MEADSDHDKLIRLEGQIKTMVQSHNDAVTRIGVLEKENKLLMDRIRVGRGILLGFVVATGGFGIIAFDRLRELIGEIGRAFK